MSNEETPTFPKFTIDEWNRWQAFQSHGDGIITLDASVLSEDEKRELFEVIVSLFGPTQKVDPLTGDLFKDD